MPIAPEDILIRNDSMPSTDLDGARVFLSLESGDYLRLAGTANAVWERLQTAMRVGALVDDLCATYGIDPDTCRGDLLPFLDSLLEAGLVSRVPAAA